MIYKLYEYDMLSNVVKKKVMEQAHKMLLRQNPRLVLREPEYIKNHKEVFNEFLYNKNGRHICTKKVYEEGEL